MRFIDDENEHKKVLFDLGLLDDDEDWELYMLQEKRFHVPEDADKYWSREKRQWVVGVRG